MKKLVTVLVLAIGFTLTTQAQKGKRNNLEMLTVEQQTELAVKKMTLKLDLTTSQQRDITPLLTDKFIKRKEMHQKRKAMKESGEKRAKLSADDRFNKKSNALDAQITFKAEMKRILNKQQYERFEKMSAKKKHKAKKKMKHRKGLKEEHSDNQEK
ncbi:hypothetical protein H0I31_02780 [Tenacibaculum sp. AHE15PA]|uniref:hypothetical protein n=1 Tax=unclassified Tenacibaculum TaxID=2635139 RepID=UPI001C4FDE23|nr:MULTISPECIES: hypothetical protein [unclassified Tenacibaculum]QXP72643.1 hypothetical protein H0I30_08040 [Tenacibaculum sp. AHE14PA]QXP76557.1 hypothetical protein H0I31_02780 [Tenacibaculum sp. AHE15PA]